MRAYLVARILAVLAVAVAVARIPWLAARHLRPPMGAEAADLHRLMLYHWGLRDHMGWTWWEQLQRDGFKPPLWYGGVPVLRLGDPTLDLASVMSVNAVILAILAVVIWRAAADMADERTITGPSPRSCSSCFLGSPGASPSRASSRCTRSFYWVGYCCSAGFGDQVSGGRWRQGSFSGQGCSRSGTSPHTPSAPLFGPCGAPPLGCAVGSGSR